MEKARRDSKPSWTWVTDYADVGPCIEMICLFDDRLKKSSTFTDFAVDVAQRILGEDIKVTYGKWGARLEISENPGLTKDGLEQCAELVRVHPSWIGLLLATHVFTYGE